MYYIPLLVTDRGITFLAAAAHRTLTHGDETVLRRRAHATLCTAILPDCTLMLLIAPKGYLPHLSVVGLHCSLAGKHGYIGRFDHRSRQLYGSSAESHCCMD